MVYREGAVSYSFPTSPNLAPHQYPDVTDTLQQKKFGIYKDVLESNTLNGPQGTTHLIANNFQPQGAWDTTSSQHPDLPNNGEYAQYKGQVVSSPYLKYNLMGNAIGAAGFVPTNNNSFQHEWHVVLKQVTTTTAHKPMGGKEWVFRLHAASALAG